MSRIARVIPEPDPDVNPDWWMPRHMGTRYNTVLGGLHDHLKPNSYVEVGVRSGDSLSLAKCPAIGVDPRFIQPLNKSLNDDDGNLLPRFKLFETTSDKFFAANDACEILGVPHIDFFFLDGAHLSAFLLRDLINSEKIARKNSIIALHDCVPLDIAMTLERKERAESPYPVVYEHHWAGDCWRVMLMLKKYRPDIEMHVMDSKPTGLVLLTNLDPTSTVLADKHDEIINEMKSIHLVDIGLRNYAASLPVRDTADYIGEANLLKHFKSFADTGKADADEADTGKKAPAKTTEKAQAKTSKAKKKSASGSKKKSSA